MPDETIRILTGGDSPDESPKAPDYDGAKIGAHIGESDWSMFGDAQPNESAQKQVTTANKLGIHNVSIKKLEKELASFMETVDQMFSRANAEADMKSIELSEIELSVAINAEGSFSLIGIGAKVTGTNAILLRFKRKS